MLTFCEAERSWAILFSVRARSTAGLPSWMAGLLRVACRSSSLLLGLRSGGATVAAVSGALETRSGRTSSSPTTTSSDASGVGGGVSGATGDAVARYTDILGCSISRSSSGDVSTFTGPARVKHAGGVTYHDSSSAVAPSTVQLKHHRSQSRFDKRLGYAITFLTSSSITFTQSMIEQYLK